MSSMTMFGGCSQVTISGGNFSVVGGNQNNHGSDTRRDLVHLADPLAQFHELKLANIRLKQKIVDAPVRRSDPEGRRRGWGNLDAHQIIHTATIRGGDENEEFLHVQYKGPDASRAYQQDLQASSAVKDSIWLELFGYINYNVLPGLVFYNALIPVAHIFERNRFSPMLKIYLSFLGSVQGMEDGTLLGELWFEPRTSTLRKGLYVDDSSNVNHLVANMNNGSISQDDHPSLNLQTYSNTNTLFQYLIGILPIHKIINGIRWSNRATSEWPNNEDAKLILSSLPGTIYHITTQEVIARYPGDKDQWYYYPWKERFHIPDAMQEDMLVMDDGSVRFMLMPADIASIESFELYYNLQPGGVWDSLLESWVLQAHGIFSQLGIEEGEWGKYSILYDFYLQFKWEQDEGESHTPTDTPTDTLVYLFIRPVPHPSDDENEWDAWLGGRWYYWSLDSTGKEEMSEDEWWRLGLPSFKTSIEVWHYWWDHDTHDAIEMVNRHEGFNPMSMDFARSLGHTILIVADGQFEEVKDDDDETLAIDSRVELAQLLTLPSEFKERIQWICGCSLLSGYTRSPSKDSPCLDGPDIADID